MSAKLTLDLVKQNFTEWRSNGGRNHRVPDYLWEQAIALKDNYKKSTILSTLGISTAQYRARLKQHEEHKTSIAAQFIDVTPPSTAISSHNIELMRPDGITLRLKNVDPQSLATLLQSFFGEPLCCN